MQQEGFFQEFDISAKRFKRTLERAMRMVGYSKLSK